MNLKNLDYKLLFISIAIFCIGIICIYSVTSAEGSLWKNNLLIKQISWMVLGILIFFLSFILGYQKFLDLSFALYVIILVLLLALTVMAPVISGAQRWFRIFGINFQPSELAKLGLILALARYIITRQYARNQLKTFLVCFFLTAIYGILIFEQPDLGTALILIPILVIMTVFSKINKKYITWLIIAGVIISPLFWLIMKDYQKERLLVFLNPNSDPLGAGYTIIQSKIAVGSGGIFGNGWLEGSQGQLNFLPEGHTDFIFAILCEEWGFLGGAVVILLFYLLIRRILNIARITNNHAAKIICVAVATLIFSQVFINIGMVIGIMPVVGIPLPFISYGGSSLIVNMASLGIVASVEKCS